MVSSMMKDPGFLQRLDHPSTRWRKMLLLLFLTGWTKISIIHGEFYDEEGPTFTLEPSRYNYFTNVQGLTVHCKAKGTPFPEIFWISQKDNQLVTNYTGVREVFPNGTIHFLPFPVSYYRPDIHDQVYVCVASNSVGKIRSRDALVRAVVSQRYDVQVEDVYISEGNDALIKCIIPDNVRDFVSVTSWTKDGSFNIFPHSGSGGKYFMTPSGEELLIEEVNRNDSSSTFRCRTVNRLSGETQLSENSARLKLTGGSGSKSDSPPSITSRISKLTLKEGEFAVLLCLTDGSPPPDIRWFRGKGGYEGLERLRQTERIRIRKNAVIIENIRFKDSGTYTCYANSTSGSDRHQIDLLVISPLIVQVVPSVLTVDIGKSAEFTCWTNNLDESAFQASISTKRQITWRKDGNEVRSNLKFSIGASGEILRISNVQREDKGLYQCFVKSDSDMVQASAELRLGDAAAQLVYRFIEQTLRPGPAVSLKCTAVGNPPPQFQWSLDGWPLPQSEKLLIGQYVSLNGDVVSHVNITSTRVEDGGLFECRANNKLGSIAHSARLNIYGPPFVRNMPGSITAVAGKDFKIKCPVAGWPIHTIVWEKDGQTLPMTRRQLLSPDGTLTVKGVDRTIDSGWYSCITSNKQGNSDRKGIQLTVVVPPKIVSISFQNGTKEGDRIIVSCAVSEGDEPMRLKWLKNNKQVLGDTLQPDKSAPPKEERFHSEPTSGLSIRRYFEALVLKIEHVTSQHAGNYTCLAQNTAGEFFSTAELVVHVPPRIAPFSFPSQVSQGSRVQAVCTVLHQADLEETNLTVTWLKDSEPIQMSMPMSRTSDISTNFAKVVHVDAYSAMLIIERVDSSHNGNYTCKISNSVEEVFSTVPLVVRVPPKWIVEPKETEVSEGSPVVIPCQADGLPACNVSWKKAMGNRPEQYRDIPVQSSGDKSLQQTTYGSLMVATSSFPEDTFSMDNGTLVIRSAKKAHQGFYLCEAINGIGTGLSKVIRLAINVPVRIKEPLQNVTTRVGSKATLKCEISGDPPIIEISWKRGLTEITSESDPRYFIRLLNNSQGIFSEMTVSNVGRKDTARYSCSAANNHGRSSALVWLYVQEPPDVPRNLHVISKTSRSVRLNWILLDNRNSPIIHFIIKYKEDSDINNLKEMTVPGQVFTETVGNLRPNKKYIFSIVAENQVGASESSEILEIKTDPESPEGKPKNVRVVAVSSSEIQVTWECQEKDTWHGDLLGYYVGYRRYREGEQYQFITVEWREGSQEYQIKKLRAFSSYEIVVQAYNAIGAGPFSESAVVATLMDVPSAPPEGMHCSPLTSHNLQLSWNPLTLEQARGLIKGYKVILERTDFDISHSDELPIIRTTPSTNLVVSGLAKYTNYSVQVAAFTEAGNGPMSPDVFCHTEEDLPGSPSAIKSVVSSSSSITVSWLPPSEPNGMITKYNVYLSSANGKSKDPLRRKRQVPPDVTKIQFEGLQVEEKYEFRVTASTRVGEGSQVVAQKVQAKNVQPAIISFGTELQAIWKTDVRLICETVGNPTVQWSRNNDADALKETDRLSVSHDGSLVLRNSRRDDGGNYTCSINGNKGQMMDTITYKVNIQVPPKAPILNVTTVSHSALNLQWKLWDSGGALIRGYILHFKAFDEWLERKISRYFNSYELKGLECGTRYQMYMTAFNRAGMGRASEMFNISTLGSTPTLTLPSAHYMIEINQSSTKVILKDVWADNGCKIHSFQVLYKEQGTVHHWTSINAELSGESSVVELNGLKAGRNYDVRVIASSSAGFTQSDTTVTTTLYSNRTYGLIDDSGLILQKESSGLPFNLDFKWIILIIVLSPTLLLSVFGICFCYWRKIPLHGHSSREHFTMGTPSSSTYLNYNQNQRNSQQMYMTVKKSTPLKGGMDMKDMDTIPQYADDISPYATFELTETRRESKGNTSIPTLDRRRTSHNSNWNPDHALYDKHRSMTRPNASRGALNALNDAKDEIYEYDSSASDSEMDKEKHSTSGLNKFIHHKNTLILGNRYELSPCAMKFQESINHIPLQNGIHGMIIADDYAFNCDAPTMSADDRTGRRSKRTNRRKSQGKVANLHASSPTYDECISSKSPRYNECNGQLDPPSGFQDAVNPSNLGENKRTKSSLSTVNGNAVINV